MQVAEVPIEVYAYINPVWCRVIGVALDGSAFVCERDGVTVPYPAAMSYDFDLFWPGGRPLTYTGGFSYA